MPTGSEKEALDSAQALDQYFALGGLSLLGSLARLLLTSDRYTFMGMIRAWIIGACSCTICFFILETVDLHYGYKMAVCLTMSLLADDALRGLLVIGKMIKEKPFEFFGRLFIGGKKD